MPYPQSKAESEELLRLLLPLISRYGSGCQPPSYGLWYEYASGTNPTLKKAVDARIARGSSLSDDETAALYAAHLAARDTREMDALQAQLQRAVEGVRTLAASASDEAGIYGQALQAYGGQLTANLGVEALRSIVGVLEAETQRMQRSNECLTGRLEASQRDLQNLKSQLNAVRNEALQDPLTGLQNRRGFQRFIDQLGAESAQGLVGTSLLMADIDHFKRVNDTHGHLVGDKVLQLVAELLRTNVKGRDLPARLGGEEFAIVLPSTPEAGAVMLAENIRNAVANSRIRRGNREIVGNITISFGVTTYRAGETMEDWIARADQALYQSKKHGRNRVTLAGTGSPGASATAVGDGQD